MTRDEIKAAVEAILFIAGEAMPMEHLADALDIPLIEMESIIREMGEHKPPDRGIEVYIHEDGIQLRTRMEQSPYIKNALRPTQRKSLSASVMETLSIIAYKQPITRTEIEAIRGVSVDYSMQVLLDRKLIERKGRKDVIGRPMLYGTTDEFLRHFNLTTLADLPPLPELEEDSPEVFEVL